MKILSVIAILIFTGYVIIAQNVGISTNAPKYRFHLSGGSDNAPVTFGLGFSDLYGEPILKFVPAGVNYLSFGFSSGTMISGNVAEGFVLTRTGNVGIGNSTPQHPLSVGPASNDGQGVTFRSYGNHGASWKGSGAFGYTGATVILGELNGKAHIGGHNPNLTAWADLYINEGPASVGIGVSSITAGYKFDVGGQAKFNGQMNLSGFKIINVATPTAGTDAVNKDYVDNLVTGNDDWDKTGNNLYPKNPTTTNVGIGTTTPTGKFQVAGSHSNGVLQDGNDRPSIGLTGSYPQLVMMSGGVANTNHGPTIMLGSFDSGTTGAHKHWSIGTAAMGSSFLDFGYYAGTDLNPHNGIRNQAYTTVMTMLNNGNVGLSNISPSYKLDVAGGIRATDRFYGRYHMWDTRTDNFAPSTYSNEMALEFKTATAIGASGSVYGGLMTIAPWSDASGGLDHQLYFNDGGISYRTGVSTAASWNTWTSLLTTAGGTNNYVPKFNGAGSLTNSSIYDNGTNIGIGTASPSAPMHMYQDRYTLYGPNSSWGANLQVGGNGRVTTGASVAATNGNLHIDAANGGFSTYINFYSQNNTLLNGAGGNVGIGTTGPASPLHLLTSSGDAFRLQSTSAESDIRFINNAYEWEVGTNNSGNGTGGNHFYVYEGGYKFTVQKGTGNVGINTAAPDASAKLHVMGSANIGGTNIASDGNDRPSILLEGTYPHFVIKSSGNTNHAGTLSFWNFDGTVTKQWNMGSGINGNFSLDYTTNNTNPHTGLDNSGGPSILHITPSGDMNLTGNYNENGVDLLPSQFCVIVPVNSGCPAGWVIRDVKWDTEDINNADGGKDNIIAVDAGSSGSIRMRFCCRNW